MTDPTPHQEPAPPHARCGAKTRSGKPCTQWPMHGQKRCKMHGGKTPNGLAAGARRIAEAEAAQAVARWGGDIDIHPAEALLKLVRSKAAEVTWWQARVDELGDDEVAGLIVTKTEQGMGPKGPVDTRIREISGHIALTLLHKTQDQLAVYSSAALKAGVDERMVRLAETQGAELLRVIDTVAAGILTAAGATLPAEQITSIITTAIDQETA